jgi:hypothetical protein|tara:strand:- start:264 stop:431 length:168 start_codon:yes stop_codon:yes gene_type:complete
MEENIIERLKLNEQEVVAIVSEWYQNGMYKDILQDENGNELCEITQDIYDNIKEK